MRAVATHVLTAFAVVGLLYFFSARWEAQHDMDAGRTKSESRLTIGSPWPWYDQRTEKTEVGGLVVQEIATGGVRFDSPAWLFLLCVITCGWWGYRLWGRHLKGLRG